MNIRLPQAQTALLLLAFLPAVLAQAEPEATVTLRFPKPLAIGQTTSGGDWVSGLEGAVEATVRNEGGTELVLYDCDIHGLLFESAGGGPPFVVLHPCDAAFLLGLQDPPAVWSAGHTHRLAPGASCTVRLEDFGCSGGPWKPPPPGRYRVRYAFFRSPLWAGATADGGRDFRPARDVPRLREKLLALLQSGGCVKSPPVDVVLKPHRHRVGR